MAADWYGQSVPSEEDKVAGIVGISDKADTGVSYLA